MSEPFKPGSEAKTPEEGRAKVDEIVAKGTEEGYKASTTHGPRGLEDINSREFLMLSLLAIAVLYMGIFPFPFTQIMDASVADFLKHVATTKLN